MESFAIIEVDNGLTVANVHPDQSAEDAARAQGGIVVDPGPFPSYDEAYDALLNLQLTEEERKE